MTGGGGGKMEFGAIFKNGAKQLKLNVWFGLSRF